MEHAIQPFTYLAVLLSIIFGLAIQQILLGYRNLILGADKGGWHAPSLLLSTLMLLVIAQNWWETFGLVSRMDWNFASYVAILVQAIIVFMLSAVIFPLPKADGTIDPGEHYRSRQKVLYLFGIAYVISSPIRAWIVDDAVLSGFELGFHAFFLLAFGLLAVVRQTWVHIAFLTSILSIFLIYIGIFTPSLTF